MNHYDYKIVQLQKLLNSAVRIRHSNFSITTQGCVKAQNCIYIPTINPDYSKQQASDTPIQQSPSNLQEQSQIEKKVQSDKVQLNLDDLIVEMKKQDQIELEVSKQLKQSENTKQIENTLNSNYTSSVYRCKKSISKSIACEKQLNFVRSNKKLPSILDSSSNISIELKKRSLSHISRLSNSRGVSMDSSNSFGFQQNLLTRLHQLKIEQNALKEEKANLVSKLRTKSRSRSQASSSSISVYKSLDQIPKSRPRRSHYRNPSQPHTLYFPKQPQARSLMSIYLKSFN